VFDLAAKASTAKTAAREHLIAKLHAGAAIEDGPLTAEVTLQAGNTITIRTMRRVLSEALGRDKAEEVLASMELPKWRYLKVIKVEPLEVDDPLD
jgi:hypothetical protein